MVLLLFCAGLLNGQSSAERNDTIAFSVDLEEFVVTAQLEPTHYSQAIHNIDVITEENMRQRGVVNVKQALQVAPSIRIYQDPILGSSIRMRGISSRNVGIMVDGVPVIGRQNGAIDISQLSTQNIQRIEIVEGPLSNIYGNNAAGGVINIITRKNHSKGINVNLESQLESIGQQNHQASLGYAWKDWTFQTHARYFEYDQFPTDSLRLTSKKELDDGTSITETKYPFNPKTQKSAGASIRYDLDENGHFLAKYDYNREDVQDFAPIRRPQFRPYANDRFYQTIRSDASLFYKDQLGDWFVDATLARNDFQRIAEEKRYYLETGEFDSLLQTADTTRFNLIFGRLNLAYQLSEQWLLTAGYNYSREEGSGDRILDRSRPDSTTSSFTENSPYFDLRYEPRENFSVSTSGRYIVHSAYDNRFTPALQLKWNPGDRWAVRAGYSQGYRSPSLKELYLEFIDINHNIIGNPDLMPEISHDLQSTVSYELSEDFSLELNAFRTSIAERIQLIQYETLKFQYDNVDAYSVYGYQPSISYQLGSLNLQSSATLSYWTTNVDAEQAPQYGEVFDMNNTLNYDWSKTAVVFNINHRYVGEQPIYRLENEEVQVRTIEAYQMVDASLSRPFWNNQLNITLGVRNLTDVQNTQVSGGSAGGAHSPVGRNIVSPGRSYFAAISLALGK